MIYDIFEESASVDDYIYYNFIHFYILLNNSKI